MKAVYSIKCGLVGFFIYLSSLGNVIATPLILSPDDFTNTLVTAGQSLARTMVISNAGNSELEFSFCPLTPMEDDGLVAHYSFNGNANDESGNGYDGTVNGAALTADRFGNADSAYVFDGINDYIEIENSLGTNATAMTISTWIRSSTTAYQVFASKKPSGEWQSGQWQMHLGFSGSTVFVYADQDGNSNLKQIVSVETGLDDGLWHHLCGIIEEGSAKLYVDGKLSSERTDINVVSQYDAPIHIGDRVYGGGQQYFNGGIDDVCIYSRALSAEEISELYSESEGEGLVAHYPFNGNADDESGNGHDGEVNGAQLTTDRFGTPDAAYDFNGWSAHINCGNIIDGFDAFTVSAWMYIDSYTDGWWMGPWSQQHFYYPAGRSSYSMWTGNNTSGPGCFGIIMSWTDGVVVNTRSPHVVPSGEWHLITQTYDGVAIREYDNGVLIDTTLSSGHSISNSADFLIGKTCAYPNGTLDINHFDGKIDDLRIYNIALPEEEIVELYNDEPDQTCTIPDWLNIESLSGIIPQGSNVEVEIEFDATNMVAGDYAEYLLKLYDADGSSIVPVSMWVMPTIPELVVEPGCTEGRINELSWFGEEGSVEYWVEGKVLRHGPRNHDGSLAHQSNRFNLHKNWWFKRCFNYTPPVWEQNSGWISATNHIFTDLRLYKKYAYRVKASVVTKIGRLETDWSNPEVSYQVRHTRNGHKICIPDWWKKKYFGHGYHCSDQDDSDGDGQCNLDEYITGMNPHDRRSAFKVRDLEHRNSSGYTVEWDSIPGRVYSVYWCKSLGDEFQLLQGGIKYPANSYTDRAHNVKSGGFYKVEVALDE